MDFDNCACSGKTLSRFIRPAVLGVLAEGPHHGYDLMRKLQRFSMFADVPPDASGVYKILKAMASEGLVTGDWDAGESGPAKRPFKLTAKGRKCLARWTGTLENYQQQISELVAVIRISTNAKLK
ncbi:MAG: PadR family transcriptional regulator [bacterium]